MDEATTKETLASFARGTLEGEELEAFRRRLQEDEGLRELLDVFTKLLARLDAPPASAEQENVIPIETLLGTTPPSRETEPTVRFDDTALGQETSLSSNPFRFVPWVVASAGLVFSLYTWSAYQGQEVSRQATQVQLEQTAMELADLRRLSSGPSDPSVRVFDLVGPEDEPIARATWIPANGQLQVVLPDLVGDSTTLGLESVEIQLRMRDGDSILLKSTPPG